ncbi:MAG: hypothetical protein JO002_07940 [Burkholderiaceae bacterium]|nr:hypothetical protein [Burkholderiaceae bacterium]
MTRQVILACAGWAAIAACRAAAWAQEISWITPDLPPLFIQSGDSAGQGYGDREIAILTRNLTEFRHVYAHGDVARVWKEIEMRPVVCTPGAVKAPEREAVAYFSERPAYIPNYRLVALERTLPSITRDALGRVDLARLRGFTVGRIKSRFYPGSVGDFLESPGEGNRVENTTETPLLINLLTHERISFFFASPVEIAFYKPHLQDGQRLVTVPVVGIPSHVEIFAACSRNDLGKRAIDHINQVMTNETNWREFVSVIDKWEVAAERSGAK